MEKKCIIKSTVNCTHEDDKTRRIRQTVKCGACKEKGEYVCAGFWLENLQETGRLEDVDVDGERRQQNHSKRPCSSTRLHGVISQRPRSSRPLPREDCI